MNKLLFVTLSVSFLSFLNPLVGGDEGERIFNVSEVGKDKTELLKVFGLISTGKTDSLGFSFEIFQRISGTEYLAYEIQFRERTYYDSDKRDLAGNSIARNISREAYIDKDKLYYLSLRDSINAISGEVVYNLDVEPTSEVYSYTNALGQQRSVRVFKELEPPPATMTKEEFVAKLREGKEWTLPKYEKQTCFSCDGSGKRSKLKGDGDCLKCRGLGYRYIDLVVKW